MCYVFALMKPKDLKSPFTWDQRKILLKDKVLFVPDFVSDYQEFVFPGWEDTQIFSEKQPVRVEFCSGNGKWIVERAQSDPKSNWVAVEKRFDRVRKIWSKIKNQNIENLFVVCGEAYISTKNYFPTETVEEVFLNFPDPWPKKRHAKHRLIQEKFVAELKRILVGGAKVTIVTDDPDYSEEIISTMLQQFSSVFPAPYFSHEMDKYGTSYFEDLWREKGKKIRYHQFEKEWE